MKKYNLILKAHSKIIENKIKGKKYSEAKHIAYNSYKKEEKIIAQSVMDGWKAHIKESKKVYKNDRDYYVKKMVYLATARYISINFALINTIRNKINTLQGNFVFPEFPLEMFRTERNDITVWRNILDLLLENFDYTAIDQLEDYIVVRGMSAIKANEVWLRDFYANTGISEEEVLNCRVDNTMFFISEDFETVLEYNQEQGIENTDKEMWIALSISLRDLYTATKEKLGVPYFDNNFWMMVNRSLVKIGK